MKNQIITEETVRAFAIKRSNYYLYALFLFLLLALTIYYLYLGNWVLLLNCVFYPFIIGYHYVRFRVHPEGLEVKRSVRFLFPRQLFIPFTQIECVERIEWTFTPLHRISSQWASRLSAHPSLFRSRYRRTISMLDCRAISWNKKRATTEKSVVALLFAV